MLIDFAKLVLGADTSGLARGRDELGRLTAAGSTAEAAIRTQTGRMGAAFRSMAGIAAAAFAAVAGASSMGSLVRMADTWTDLSARVQLAIGPNADAADIMERLSDMARRTYSSLQLTTEGWLRSSTVLRELGLTLEQSLGFQEALNNALVVSGARGDRAARVQTAIGRAMAMGALRGEELNAIIEDGGRVAELLAQELGITTTQLRAVGAEGRITGDVVRRALLGNLELLREEADSMPATVGDAFVLMGNATLALVGTFDQAIGASSALASGIIFIADNLETTAGYVAAAAIGLTTYYLPALVAATFQTGLWIASLVTLRGALLATGFGAFVVLAGMAINWLVQLSEKTGGFGNALAQLGVLAGGVWSAIAMGARAIPAALDGVWSLVKVNFSVLIGDLSAMWADFLRALSPELGGISTPFGDFNFGDLLGLEEFAASAEALGARIRAATSPDQAAAANSFTVAEYWLGHGIAEANYALERFNANTQALGEDGVGSVTEVTATVAEMAEALEGAGGAARSTTEEVRGLSQAAESWASGMAGHFDGLITGGKGLSGVIQSLARQLESRAWQMFFQGIAGFSGGRGGGFFGSLLGTIGSFFGLPSFEGGGDTGSGPRSGGLDGRGGHFAILHPDETVIDRRASSPRGSFDSSAMSINVSVTGANGDQHIIRLVQQGVSAGLRSYDSSLPERVRGITQNPRRGI